MNQAKKAVIIAPFWGDPQHIGTHRIRQFIWWLVSAQVEVVLVRAGRSDRRRQEEWGTEITVRDPLGLHSDSETGTSKDYRFVPTRRPNPLRRWAAYLLLNPDPTVVWARTAARHPTVLEFAQNASWVVSSSPPETAHVASFLLAKHLKTDLIIDLRDGWLDEPLRPRTGSIPLQRYRERRWETRILRNAKQVLVTSPVWQRLLEERLPITRGRITMLTNMYPAESGESAAESWMPKGGESLKLVYAGRFTGSRTTRKADRLLEPLLTGLRSNRSHGEVTFVGDLASEDLEQLDNYRTRFEEAGWSLAHAPSVPRGELARHLATADGLLLLTVGQATIPLKFYDYLVARRPILAVTPRGSAMSQIGETLPQVFLLDPEAGAGEQRIREFLKACADPNVHYQLPSQFEQSELAKMFFNALGIQRHIS